ncbi:MAG: rhodanese-like domain-containing protein [Candidatus Pacebacteria bacterium]|nr:rhodanese-like domain-containing protein [Candidatus Paceibacterota bacterium]
MQMKSAVELQKILAKDAHTVIIDVTRETHFQAHHIVEAVNIPYRARQEGSSKNIFVDLFKELKLAFGTPIIVYGEHTGCRLAYMAHNAIEELGYTNVSELKGGLHGWIIEGGTTEPKNITHVTPVSPVVSPDPITAELLKKGYAEFKFSGYELASNAGSAFADFLTLPQQALEEFKPPAGYTPTRLCTHGGYLAYAQPEKGRPTIENFVISPVARELFSESFAKYPQAQAFISAANALQVSAEKTLRELLTTMESTSPGITQAFFPEGEELDAAMWFMKYPHTDTKDENGKMSLCRPHFDLGALTIGLWENGPGLRAGSSKDTITYPGWKSGEALFLPGADFWKVSTPGAGPAWHEVIQHPNDSWNEDIARLSIVFFMSHSKDSMCSVCDERHAIVY